MKKKKNKTSTNVPKTHIKKDGKSLCGKGSTFAPASKATCARCQKFAGSEPSTRAIRPAKKRGRGKGAGRSKDALRLPEKLSGARRKATAQVLFNALVDNGFTTAANVLILEARED